MVYTEAAKDLMYSIKKELDMYPAYISKDFILSVNSFINETGEDGLEIIEELTKNRNIFAQIYAISAKLYFKHDYNDIKRLYSLMDSPELSFYNRYFLYYQIQNYIFTDPGLDTEEMFIIKEKLLNKLLNELAATIGLPDECNTKLNDNFIVVVASQILSTDHAPTKTALDRCAVIKKSGRNVMLINTAETFSAQGNIPFYGEKEGTYNADLSKRQSLNWLGEEIPYFQCDNNMPDPAQIEMLINFLVERRPGLVISIGGTGLFAGVCARYFPVLTVSLYPSSLEPALSQYQTLGRKLNGNDLQLLGKLGRTSDYVIEGNFTYSFKPQSSHFNREDLSLNDTDFVICVIGTRLEAEVTSEFIEILNNLNIPSVRILFVGGFSGFEEFADRYRLDRNKFIYAGYSDDVLAMLELCDLYVNPYRKGGGSSALEALFKGVPVVTPFYGDVAVNVGGLFCAKQEDIPGVIEKYYYDKDFYRIRSYEGRKRANYLLDDTELFGSIINEVFLRHSKNGS